MSGQFVFWASCSSSVRRGLQPPAWQGGLEDYKRQRVPSAWALVAEGWRRPVAFLGFL